MLEKREKKYQQITRKKPSFHSKTSTKFHNSTNSQEMSQSINLVNEGESMVKKSKTNPPSFSSELFDSNNINSKRLSTTMTIRQTKQQIFIPWHERSRREKTPIKWIGVHFPDQGKLQNHYKEFPKRKQKSYDQSLANFLLRYGKYVKENDKHLQPKKSLHAIEQPVNPVSNGATTKLKTKINWFQKKRHTTTDKKIGFIGFG